MKPTPKQILNFVESAGGIVRVMKALKLGSERVAGLTEAIETHEAALAVAAEANEDLQTKLDEALVREDELKGKLDEANALVESKVAQRRSGAMFTGKTPVTEAVHPHQRASLAKRLVGAR